MFGKRHLDCSRESHSTIQLLTLNMTTSALFASGKISFARNKNPSA
jgi:hypothetical protein